MSLLSKFLDREIWPEPKAQISQFATIEAVRRGPAVSSSRDLRRVLELPTRPEPTPELLGRLVSEYTSRFARENPRCECKSLFNRPCVKRLKPLQAQALHEISDPDLRAGKAVGLFAPIPVGGGKTLLDLLAPLVVPGCKRAVLLIPANLRNQLLEFDWGYYGQHWTLPNLAGGRFFTPGRPVLNVVSYSELSSARHTDLLERLAPDTVIADEGHCLRFRTAARTKRFLRYFNSHPDTRFLTWSGTLTSRSVKDYGHLVELSLGEGSPLPIHYPTLEEWAGALDSGEDSSPPGALLQLCRDGEDVRAGFQRRLRSTKGVVASSGAGDCGASLVIGKRVPPSVPTSVRDALLRVDASWTRPDGEELVSALATAALLRQLSYGFFYRWIYPRGESPALIDEWFRKRQDWHRELREKLKHARPHLDSPLLCTKAAIRHYEGKAPTDGSPVWRAEAWPDWREIRTKVEPTEQTVWIDQWLAKDAAEWAKEKPGIVWYEFQAFGRKVGEFSGLPVYGGGAPASSAIAAETGGRSICASIAAHGTGKNLQHAFARNLVANVPPSGLKFEQLIGRTHRSGQLADEVIVDLYQHTDQLVAALERAREDARYVEATLGTSQKLNQATFTF